MKSLGLVPWMIIEKLINELLERDPKALERLQKLHGKTLRFDIKELPFELTVAVDQQGLRLSTVGDEQADCWIQTELGVLPELRDTANLTRLIKTNKLDIEGDPLLAQQLVSVIRTLDIDWEAELAKKIGEAPAHWLGKLWRQSRANVQQSFQSQQRWLTGVVIEEKQWLPARTEFEMFKQQVQQLRADVERLDRRLQDEVKNA